MDVWRCSVGQWTGQQAQVISTVAVPTNLSKTIEEWYRDAVVTRNININIEYIYLIASVSWILDKDKVWSHYVKVHFFNDFQTVPPSVVLRLNEIMVCWERLVDEEEECLVSQFFSLQRARISYVG